MGRVIFQINVYQREWTFFYLQYIWNDQIILENKITDVGWVTAQQNV